MTRADRLALLGPQVIAEIHDRVKAAPEPPDHVVDALRRIVTRPAGQLLPAKPAAKAAA